MVKAIKTAYALSNLSLFLEGLSSQHWDKRWVVSVLHKYKGRTYYLVSDCHGQRAVGCNPEGWPYLTNNRLDWERWQVVASDNGTVMIRNVAHNKYLLADYDGNQVQARDQASLNAGQLHWHKWWIQSSQSGDKVGDGR